MSHNNNGSDHFSDHFHDSLAKRITGAFSLITLGIFFLLNSTGVIPWSAWMTVLLIFFRIWPIFIILAGLQIIFHKSSAVKIILDIFSSLIFAFVLLLAAYANTTNSTLKNEIEKNIPALQMFKISIDSPDYAQKNLSSTIEEIQLTDVSQRELNLNFTSEEFSITVDKSEDNYLKLDANYHSMNSEPFLESKLDGSNLVIDSGVKHLSTANIFAFNSSPKYKYIIGQNELPTSINIDMTSGSGEIDLTDLNADSLTIKETSGNIYADLSTSNVKSVKLEMTSGNSTLVFSEDMHVEIIYSKTSGNLEFNGEYQSGRAGRISLGDANSNNVVKVDLQLTSGNMNVKTK